jgi:hypothetical protein
MRLETEDLRRAYLVRRWQEGGPAPGGEPQWRFSVEEVLGERRKRGFDSLEALMAFLREELVGGGSEWAAAATPPTQGHGREEEAP